MLLTATFAFAASFSAITQVFVLGLEELTHETFLDPEGRFHLAWRYNETSIDIEYTAATRGWMAFALSPNGGMNQSDVMIAWIDLNGETVIQDRWLDVERAAGVVLSLDDNQSWNLVDSHQNGSHTTVRVTRELTTCDPTDRPFTNDTMRIIFSSNPVVPTDTDNISKHTARGAKSILFFSEGFRKNKTQFSETNLLQMDVRMDKAQIPFEGNTVYYCKLIKLPQISQTYHIIGFRPLLDWGNEKMVRRLVVYLCDPTIQDSFEPKQFTCHLDQPDDTSGSGNATSHCRRVWAVWASGGGDIMYPDEAGLPVTAELSDRYVMLEVQYDLSMRSNFANYVQTSDSSGVTMILTSQLRRYDAATMVVGVMNMDSAVIIPSNATDFVVSASCESNCTNSFFPEDGINVFQVLLHTHAQGQRIYVRHVRDGSELATIGKDDYYDANYQNARELVPARKVLQGDKLVVECHYSTMKTSDPTFGGYGADEELCLAFLTYYPATEMISCGALVDRSALSELANLSEDSTLEDLQTMFSEQFQFSPENVAALQDLYNNSDFTAFCGTEDMATASMQYSSSPEPYTPYHEDDGCPEMREDRSVSARMQEEPSVIKSDSSSSYGCYQVVLVFCVLITFGSDERVVFF